MCDTNCRNLDLIYSIIISGAFILKVQIVSREGQLNYNPEYLTWVKSFAVNVNTYYPNIQINDLDIQNKANILAIDADIYIYPISPTQIKVGVKEANCFSYEKCECKSKMHRITINNKSDINADALSTFLILLMGISIIPSGLGCYNTDLEDLMCVLQCGNHATLVSNIPLNTLNSNSLISLAGWFNRKGKFIENFYRICELIQKRINRNDALSIINVTSHPTLKDSSVLLLVTN